MPNAMDNLAYRFPVSVKGVVLIQGRVPLLENERNEWELPGGKLELGETPVGTCARELEEELNIRVRVERILDSWVYSIEPRIHVLIVTYGCTCIDATSMRMSDEHKQLALFRLHEVDDLTMPLPYKESVRRWASLVGQ